MNFYYCSFQKKKNVIISTCSWAPDYNQKPSKYNTRYPVFRIWHRPDTSTSGQPVGPCRTHVASSDRIRNRVTGVPIQTGGTGWLLHPCGVTGIKSACSPPRTGIIIIIIISSWWYIMLWIFFYATVRWTVRRSKQQDKIKQVFYYYFFRVHTARAPVQSIFF